MKKTVFYIIWSFVPAIAFAQSSDLFSDFRSVVGFVLDFINPLIGILAALSMLAFFWGLAKFVLIVGSQKDHAEGAKFMLWSIVALFVMVSIYGLISLLQGELGITDTTVLPTLPQ